MEHIEHFNTDVERSLIGALILDNFQRTVTSDVQPRHFYLEAHQIIYQALVKMIDDKKPVDVILLAEELEGSSMLEYVGGLTYVSHVVQNTPSSKSAKQYAAVVLEKSAEREMLAAAETIRELAAERSGRSIAERQAEAVKTLGDIAETASFDIQVTSTNDAIQEAVKQVMQRMDRPQGVIGGLSTGIKTLDESIDGYNDGELYVIGGRTSMGKSVLGLQGAIAAAKAGNHAAYFSFEMPAKSLALRGACSIGGVSYKALKTGRLTEEQLTNFTVGVSQFSELPISIIDRSGLRLEQIAAACRRLKFKQGLKAIFIDHLHLMPVGNNANRASALGDITSGLQRLCRELNVPMILLAQLNREAAKSNRSGNAISPPTLTDLRDSGTIEQDADTVILIHRESYYNPELNPGEAQLIIAKNRNGERQTIRCGWNGDFSRFEQYPADWSAELCQKQSEYCDV